jgi:hypothetical protein
VLAVNRGRGGGIGGGVVSVQQVDRKRASRCALRTLKALSPCDGKQPCSHTTRIGKPGDSLLGPTKNIIGGSERVGVGSGGSLTEIKDV